MTATQQQRSSKALLEQSPPRSWVNGPTKLMLSPRSICSLTSFSSRPVSIQKAALLDVGDDQTDLVDVRVEQQVRTALLRGHHLADQTFVDGAVAGA